MLLIFTTFRTLLAISFIIMFSHSLTYMTTIKACNTSRIIRAQAAAANEREQRRVEQEHQAHQELNQICHYKAGDIALELKNSIDGILGEISGQIAQPFREQRKQLNESAQKVQEDLEALRDLADRYSALYAEMKVAEAAQ